MRSVLFRFSLSLLVASSMMGQVAPPVTTGGPASLTALLKQHHVELTEAGLLEALHNTDPQVRYLAAAKLAERKAVDAVPAITQALSVEKVPATRINIAFALAQLGQENGVQELTSACVDGNLSDTLRARAATYLLDLQKDGCLSAVMAMLKPEADPSSQIQALSLLPRYKLSAEESQEALALIVRALGNQEAAVRINASVALGVLGNTDAIPHLESAIVKEKDDVVRSQMHATLETLSRRRNQ